MVCDTDYKAKQSYVQVHHYHYVWNGASVLGNEIIERDLCLLCKEHHMKGSCSKAKILKLRRSYLRRKNRMHRFERIINMLREHLFVRRTKGVIHKLITKQKRDYLTFFL